MRAADGASGMPPPSVRWFATAAITVRRRRGTPSTVSVNRRCLGLAIVAGMSVVFWAFATWLIPVLIAAGVWRHFLRRIPLVYQPTLWSMVFPLGMYAVAGIYLGRADRLPVVEFVGTHWFWVALLAWVLVAGGMGVDIARKIVAARPST